MVNELEQVSVPLIDHPWVERAVPEHLRGSGSIDELRARILVLSTVALWLWGPLFAALPVYTGHWGLAAMVAATTIVVGPAPLILHLTGSFAVAANLVSVTIWLLLGAVLPHTGGLHSPVIFWYCVVPIFPYIFGLTKSFRAWLAVTVATPIIFWGLETRGYDLTFVKSYDDFGLLWVIAVTGGIILVIQLFVLNGGLQRWLSQKVRLREAEKRRTEAALHKAEQREAERKMENKMLEMDRMVAVGTLAAGVAHEINNPLAFVHANVEYLLAQTEKYADEDGQLGQVMASREDIIEVLEDIREGSLRIRNIVSDLSAFSTTDRGEAQPLDIEEVLESCIRMSENHIRHRARLVRDYHADVPAVHGVESSLAQVFLNLLINAAQSIEMGDVEANEVRLTIRLADASETVVVEVSDTGGGIPEDIRTRIFDPFFSTKDQHEGMGMGLAICRKLVRSHGGNIYFETTEGQGTTFTVELPADPKEAEESNRFQRPTFANSQKGRALVIDDEKQVARTIRRTLIDSYQSVMVSSGREALELLEEDRDFSVIICDLLMPNITGVEVHAEIGRRFPEMVERMVFVTGGTFTEATREFVDACDQPIVAKPFDMTEFRQVVDATAVVV